MILIVCYLRHGDRVFETYWTTRRGVEVMGNRYPLLDLTVYGRQETWEDSPVGWPQQWGKELAGTCTVPTDVPSSSGLASTPGIPTISEPAGAEPRPRCDSFSEPRSS